MQSGGESHRSQPADHLRKVEREREEKRERERECECERESESVSEREKLRARAACSRCAACLLALFARAVARGGYGAFFDVIDLGTRNLFAV